MLEKKIVNSYSLRDETFLSITALGEKKKVENFCNEDNIAEMISRLQMMFVFSMLIENSLDKCEEEKTST